jgi:hypothetical protein
MFNHMIAVGAIEPADDEEPDSWAADMPSWRRAAAGYHRDRAGRATIVETRHESVTRAAISTIDALMLELRTGTRSLTRPETVRRLSMLDPDQLKTVCRRVQAFQPGIAQPWSAAEVDLLISAWSKR